MHRFALLAIFIALVGCSKKRPPEAVDETDVAPAVDTNAADRAKLLAPLKSSNAKTRADAVDEAAVRAQSDPQLIEALVELLKDKSTAGSGKTHPMQIASVREAAARTLLQAGPKGEAALNEKGFTLLRDGLNDPDAAVREHTAHTIGVLGPVAMPLSPDVQKLCINPDVHVREAAFEALRSIGGADPVKLAELLANGDVAIARLAGEQIVFADVMPKAAVPSLTTALGSTDANVRRAAAECLGKAGPEAAPAMPRLIEAIRKEYPATYDPTMPDPSNLDPTYWQALARIGGPAVGSTSGLLSHTNPIVRSLAAQTLGEIGPSAKTSVEKLKELLKDPFSEVGIEAACALCRIGEGKDEAEALMKSAIDSPGMTAMTAIDAIPRMGDAGKPLVPAAVAKLGSNNPYARYAAVGLVGTLDPKEATQFASEVGKLSTDMAPNDQLRQAIRLRVGTVLEKLGPAAAPAAEALALALPNEKDDAVRDQFIDALIAMGPGAKPALPALLPLVKDKAGTLAQRTRLIAAVAVADPSSPEVAVVLVAASSDADANMRAAVAAALGKLNPLPRAALDKLLAMAKTDRTTIARLAAFRALAAAGPQAKPAKSELEAIATGKIPEFALLAKVALASIDGNVAKSAGDVRAALTDKSGQTRAAAIGSLLLIGPTSADLPALVKLLRDGNSTTREAAAKCIGKLGPSAKEAVPLLIKLLDDRDSDVRNAAAEALGDIGPVAQSATVKLKQLGGSAAQKALEKLGVKK